MYRLGEKRKVCKLSRILYGLGGKRKFCKLPLYNKSIVDKL